MGSLALMPLGELLDLMARRAVTGSLTCERGAVRKTLLVRDSAAVGASSNDPREYLGQLLINFGHLTEEQLAKAFQTQEETKVRLGKVLTMVSLVSADVVRQAVGIKIRETILDVFGWDSGVFTVEEGAPPPVDELDVSVPLADLAREAEFRATAWSAFRAAFPSGSCTLAVEGKPAQGPMGPDTVDGRLLAAAAEGKTIDEIGLVLHATEFHLYQRLFALAQRGIVRALPAPSAPPERGGEAVAASDLLERARHLLAEDRAAEAEEAASRALELAPAMTAARGLLVEAQRRLAGSLRAGLEPSKVPRRLIPASEIPLLRLSSAEKYLLAHCDGSRDLRGIVQVAPLSELEVLKALRRFVDSKVIEVR